MKKVILKNKAEAKKIDKFYTKPEIAKECLRTLNTILPLKQDFHYLEPAAGDGSFSHYFPKIEAYDLLPEKEGIQQADFLTLSLPHKDYITIGNPPFGKRCQTAMAFFEKAALCSKAIAFIVPVTFLKWSVQSQLNPHFSLVYSKQLPEDSFTLAGESYSVRCCFQIWVNKEFYPNMKDLRVKQRPKTTHPDFQIWQHNATLESRKYLEEPWTIASWRQGYRDYSHLFSREDYNWLREQVYNTNSQFFFIKPRDEEVERFILAMDFEALAKRNMTTPGFGKADFVSYYEELRENQIK